MFIFGVNNNILSLCNLNSNNFSNFTVILKRPCVPGMPTYGRSFTLSNPNHFKVNSPASAGGKAGEYTKESGFLAYYEVRSILETKMLWVWNVKVQCGCVFRSKCGILNINNI